MQITIKEFQNLLKTNQPNSILNFIPFENERKLKEVIINFEYFI